MTIPEARPPERNPRPSPRGPSADPSTRPAHGRDRFWGAAEDRRRWLELELEAPHGVPAPAPRGAWSDCFRGFPELSQTVG